MLALFEASTARLLAEVEQATQQLDRATLQRAMHTLKSSAAVVGAMEVAMLADRQDSLLRSGAPPASLEDTMAAQLLGHRAPAAAAAAGPVGRGRARAAESEFRFAGGRTLVLQGACKRDPLP